jgi:hypothetical protein
MRPHVPTDTQAASEVIRARGQGRHIDWSEVMIDYAGDRIECTRCNAPLKLLAGSVLDLRWLEEHQQYCVTIISVGLQGTLFLLAEGAFFAGLIWAFGTGRLP